MTFARRIPEPTKAEQQRQDECRRWGCIHCWMLGLVRFNEVGDAWSPAGTFEIHHQTENGFTQSQAQTVCSCTWHHRGVCRPGMTTSEMTAAYGPSLAKGSVPFYEEFGRNDEQLQFQNELIARAEALAA